MIDIFIECWMENTKLFVEFEKRKCTKKCGRTV